MRAAAVFAGLGRVVGVFASLAFGFLREDGEQAADWIGLSVRLS